MEAQDEAVADLHALHTLSLALYEDLVDQRARITNGGELRSIDFLQFWVAVSPLSNATRRRRFSMARDWAYRALVDSYRVNELDQTIEVGRVIRFRFLADPALADQVVITLLDFAAHVFYVAEVTADMFDLVRPLVPELSRLMWGALTNAAAIGSVDLADAALDAALAMLGWFDLYDEPRAMALAPVLDRFEDDERIPEDPRKRVAVVLSGSAGRHTELPPADRARRTLERYGDRLAGQERLGLLANMVVGQPENAIAQLPELLAAIDAYAVDVSEASPVDRLYDRGRLFRNYLGGLVRTLAPAGAPHEALQLIGRWQGVKEVRGHIVLLLAADPGGTLWISGSLIRPGSTDPATLPEVIEAANEALGLAITYNDAGEAGGPHAVNRPGLPNHQAAAVYERACERHVGLHGLAELHATGVTAALAVVPGLPIPISALAHRATGVPWPIASSLRAPKPDRQVRRVAIWATAVAGVDEELEAVRSLFDAAAIEIEVMRHDLTVERFRTVYARNDLDVLWLTCHGAQELFRPEEARIVLSDGHDLSLEEMLDLQPPDGHRRRLLVLNACDSGTGAIFGGPMEFAIGAVLAGPSQAVIGHMWSIGVIQGAGFGAVLAAALAHGSPYLESFGTAIAALRDGGQGLLHALDGAPLCGELRHRLQPVANRELDHPADILDWGSPSFFE